MHMRHRMKTLVTAVAAWALALTGTARAGVTETSTAAMADTRAGVLAEILPASCSLELDDDFVLKITLNADIVGTLDLPENLEDLNFVLNGHSITGAAGAYATEGGAAATDGQPAVVVHDGTTVTFTGDGAVIGGKGGDGDPAGAGAPAVADGNGNEIANPSVASGTVTFEKGQHGLIQPVTATSTAAVADTRADVLAEILPASCSYELGDDSVLKVILSADVLGTVNLPENFNNLNFVLNGHSIVGTAGADAAEGAPATAGQPAVVIPEGTFVTFTGDGSVVGGKGGDGNDPAAAGGFAVADASGTKIADPSVTPGTTVTFTDGERGQTPDEKRAEEIKKEIEELNEPNEIDITVTIGEDGEAVVTLNEDLTDTFKLPDNIGETTLDLNGHTILIPDAEDGTETTAGADGKSAIAIVDGGDDKDVTQLTVTGGTEAKPEVRGGNGGDGNAPGNGGAGIEVAEGAQADVKVSVDEKVDVEGGNGGKGLGNEVPGGNGGAGVDGDVGTNAGTITGGNGGDAEKGPGGNGGQGVTGEVEKNDGTIADGNGGKVDPIPPETITVTAITVDDASGLVTIGAKLSFRAEHAATYAGFTAWAKDNLKVKSSTDLLALDAATAELPKTLDVTPFTGTVTEMDVTLTVEKKAAQAEFYRLVGIIE